MPILLDTRERGLIPLLPTATVEQLQVGDAILQDKSNKSIVIVERKTTADFVASFLDGRYREQRTRLLAYCQEHKAKALYILEGGVSTPCRTLERPAIQKLIHRLMLRYGIPVWPTTSLEDTATTLQLLEAQINDDAKVFEGEQVSYTDVLNTSKKANLDDPKTFLIGSLLGCPGVSAKAATAIVEVFPSFDALLKAEQSALASIKVGTRRLGPAVAGRLYSLLHAGAQTQPTDST
jgi:ERCC4-type nuclease